MTTEELIEAYRRAAIRHRTATMEGNSKATNRAYDEVVHIYHQVRSGEPAVREAFLGLLDDDELAVRSWAAVHALELDPDRAVAVLREIAAGPPSAMRLSAEYVLLQWEEGTFCIP